MSKVQKIEDPLIELEACVACLNLVMNADYENNENEAVYLLNRLKKHVEAVRAAFDSAL